MIVHISVPKYTNQKEKITNAALKLFAKKGYSSTPVSLIAKTAGVSQGLLFNFFASKEEVLKEIAVVGFRQIQLTTEVYKEESDPRKAIELHINNVINELQANTRFWRMVHIVRLQEDVLKTIGPLASEIVEESIKLFTKAFATMGREHPEQEALLLFAQIDGLVALYLFNNSLPLETLAQVLINRYTK